MVAEWAAVLPVRELAHAKSRLKVADRPLYAMSFLHDVLAALRASWEVGTVVVVTPDPMLSTVQLNCPVIQDTGIGINNAVKTGADWLMGIGHRGPVVVLLPDLPALRAHEFDAMLRGARCHSHTFLADSSGTGTTCVTADRAHKLKTGFGKGSADQHRRWRFTEMKGFGRGLTQEVDTVDDLMLASKLGVGGHTSALLASANRREEPETQATA